MKIPGPDRKFKGQFPGNYFGNLWQTFNIDLEKYPGRLALSDKMLRMNSGLGVVMKFIRTDATTVDQWFGLCGGDILRNGISVINSGTWISDDTSGTFNDPLDGVVHEFANGEQRLIVTRPSDIAVLNTTGVANAWDVDWGSTIPSTPIPVVSPALTFRPIARLQRLVAIANKVNGIAKIDTIDKTDTVTLGALTFPAGFTVRNIYTSSNRFWIGLQNDIGGSARIIEWDGTSTTYNNEYDLVGTTPLVGFIVKDIPYFIDDKGYIYRYSGGGFNKIQNFDFEFRVSLSLLTNYGAFVEGDIVYLNIGMPTLLNFNATTMPTGTRRHRPGIWIFNTSNLNLYHNMGIGEFASAGTDINYGSLYGDTNSAGAIIKDLTFNVLVTSASVYVGGATWQAAQANGIYYRVANNVQNSNTGRNRGYFITPYITTSDIEAIWEGLSVKFKRFVNANNRIVVKWRVVDPLFNASAQDQAGNYFESGGINAPMTWVNTTSFTCKVPTGVSVGDEVEILTGDNAGCSFAISTLSAVPDNSTLITVTITEAAPTSSTDTSLVRFDNWKTETAISSTTVGNQRVAFQAVAQGEFIQLKVELRGFDIQIDDLIPVEKSKTSVKQS